MKTKAAAQDKRVESTSDERAIGDGVWFYLKAGWHHDGTHMIHEDTPNDCRARLPEVKACQCTECAQLTGNHSGV